MMKTIDTLRADMIKARLFSYKEISAFRYLSPGMDQQREKVKEALGACNRLTSKMAGCGQVDEWNNVRYCKVPLCPRCFLRERTKQTRQAIRRTFAGATNNDLAFATILLPPVAHLSEVRQLMQREKRKFINLVDRKRRNDIRWNNFQMLGWWEMDRMRFADFNDAGRKTQIALDNLGFPIMGADDDTIWRPHLHVIIETGGLPLEDIKAAFKTDGRTGPYQVHIEQFAPQKPVNKNIQCIVRYCLKFRIETDFKTNDPSDFDQEDRDTKKSRSWWPDADIKAYVMWLNGDEMSGFRSLRFVVGKKKKAVTRPDLINTDSKAQVVSKAEGFGETFPRGMNEVSPKKSSLKEDIFKIHINSKRNINDFNELKYTNNIDRLSNNNKLLLDTN